MNSAESMTGMSRVAVAAGSANPAAQAVATSLAVELGLPLVGDDGCVSRGGLVLFVCDDRIELGEDRRGAPTPTFVDFVRGTTGYRRRSPGGTSRRQPIAHAVGLRHGPLTVVDATAGLGRDSFLLASLGCSVVMVERNAVLGALIRDGLSRADKGAPSVREVARRMSLVVDDARRVLSSLKNRDAPDVVYVDPMYPPRRKTALAKKELRLCRRLVGDDSDAGELLAVARGVARRRVVVKRHRYASPLAPDTSMEYVGKQVRYDVYLQHRD